MITNPNPNNCGSQFALVASVKDIVWSPGNCSSGLVNISYSTNGGNSWTSLVTNSPDDGHFEMTFTTSHVSNNFRLRVSCTTGGYCAETCNYVVNGDNVAGCMDPNAHNYNPNATWDNGTCQTCHDGIINGDENGIDCGGSNQNCNPCNPGNNVEMTGPCNNNYYSWTDDINITWNTGSNSCNRVWFEVSDDGGQNWLRIFNVATGVTNDGNALFTASDYGLTGNILIRITCTNNSNNYSTLNCPIQISTCGNQPPSNDNPCGATTVPVVSQSCNYQTFSTCDFTTSNVTNPNCQAFTEVDLWFKMIVPSSGNIIVQTQNISSSLPAFALYLGSCNNLSLLDCNGYDTSTYAEQEYKNLNPGTTVYLRWWSSNFYFGSVGDFQLCAFEPESCSGEQIAWPQNITVDCPADAYNLSITGDVYGESTLCPTCNEATFTDDDNFTDCEGGTINRQWNFTDECSTNYLWNQIIYINAPHSNLQLHMMAPPDITISCEQDYSNRTITGNNAQYWHYCAGTGSLNTYIDDSNIDYCTNSGYVIRYWQYIHSCGQIATDLQFIYVEENGCDATRCEGESCFTAEEITTNGFYYCDGPSFGNGATSNALDRHADWFYFIAPTDGFFEINSCYQNVETRLHIYDGNCTNLNNLGTSDSGCPLQVGGNNWASILNINVSCGNIYYIEWDNTYTTEEFNFEFLFYPANACNSPTSVVNLPEESFESGLGSFSQNTCDDDLDWIIHSGPTPSTVGNGVHETGPDSAYRGDYYLYVEASGNANKTAILTSTCYDLSGMNEPAFSFVYNMWGDDIGTLERQYSIDDGLTWNTIGATLTSSNGDNWFSSSVNLKDLTSYASVSLRLVATVGNGYQSDIAIDYIRFFDFCPDSWNLSGTYTNIFAEAKNYISTSTKIISGSATFDAGQCIELKPGFEVQLGVPLHAFIDGCDN